MMPAGSDRIARALADREKRAILEMLLRGPCTQKEIRNRTKLSSGTLSKHMAELEGARLVTHPGGHAAYALTARDAIKTLLMGLAELAHQLSAAEAREEADHAAAIRRADLKVAGSDAARSEEA